MKLLLTGANGQVGREVVNLLPEGTLGCHLVAFAKAELDITDLQQVDKAVRSYRPDVVINAAAYTAVDKEEQEQECAFSVNANGAKNVAEVCKQQRIPLIHLSTDYVFDGSKKSAYVEENKRAPLNVYGASKAAGEVALEEVGGEYIILRTSWVFGRYGHNFVKTILKLAMEKEELKIVSDQVGCPTAASDIALTLLFLAKQIMQGSKHWGTFHYCGNKSVSWAEFADVILKQGQDLFSFRAKQIQPITSAEFPRPAKRPKNSVLNVEKIRKEYGVWPSEWEKALRHLCLEVKILEEA